MSLQTMREYLLSLAIPADDKRYALSFYKKLDYLESLREKASIDTHQAVHAGYGCVNSKICLVFKDAKAFSKAKDVVQAWMDEFKINFWQTWITFVDKTDDEYAAKMEYLACEIHAIHPDLLYVFGEAKEEYDNVIQALRNLNAPPDEVIPQYSFFIDFADLESKDEQVRQEVWRKLRYFINFKVLDLK